jgi:hypothetical protein
LGTRLLAEHMIKTRYPHLRYIRVHTSGRNAAVIYAWNEELELSDKEIDDIRRFAAGYLSPYVCFKVKAYPMVENDRVPRVQELPQTIANAAMNRSLDDRAILALINNVLSSGEMIFQRYDANTGTVHFDVRSASGVSDIEKELIERYLYELVPVGASHIVNYA